MTYLLQCADCKIKKEYTAPTMRGLCDLARADGWAIRRKNKAQWCPKCAKFHRHVGRRGHQTSSQSLTPQRLDI